MIKFLNQKWSRLLITHCCPPTTESSALYLDHRPLCFERRLLRFVQSYIERRTSTTDFSAAGSGQSTSHVAQGAKFVESRRANKRVELFPQLWQTKNGTAMGTVLRIVVLLFGFLCFLAAFRRLFGGLFFVLRLKCCRFGFEFSEFCA